MKIIKKLSLIVLPVLALILLLLPVTAFASATAQETEIADLAETHEKIKTAQCLVYQRTCVIAIQTEKFTDKSEYDSFRNDLQTEILQKYNFDRVIISRNPKIMHAIDKLQKMSESEREQAIEKFLQQFENSNGRPPMIQPR